MAQISSNKCNVCVENEGRVYCYECQHFLCETCRNWHGKFPATKRHTVTASCNVDKSIFTTKLMCDKHGSEYIHYCQTCTSLICALCATSDHKCHSLTNLSHVVVASRKRLNELTGKLTSKIQKITDLMLEIKSVHAKRLEKEIADFRVGVNSVADYLHSIVDLVSTVHNKLASDFQILEQQHTEYTLAKLEKLKAEYSSVFAKLEHVQQTTHDMTFFVQFESLSAVIEQLDEITNVEEYVPNNLQSFIADDYIQSILEKIQERFVISSLKTKDEEITVLLEKMKNEKERVLVLHKQKDEEISRLQEELHILRESQKNKNVKIKRLEEELETLYVEIKRVRQDLQSQRMEMSNKPVYTSNRTIQLFVKDGTGKGIVISANTGDNIENLKRLIHDKMGIVPESQLLYIPRIGKELRNSLTLNDYGIRNGNVLDLRTYQKINTPDNK